MFTEFDTATKMLGFGRTKEEAEEDLIFNKVRSDINHDMSGKYAKRRLELYSWLPLRTLLSIKSVCGISYDKGYLTNTVTNKAVMIEPKPFSHYLYLYYLLGYAVNFEDFTVTMAKEVNKFLEAISPAFGKLSDFPYIKPGEMEFAVNIHHLKCGGFVCDTSNNAILVCDGKQIISIDLLEGVDRDCLIAYGLAKLGIAYNGYDAYMAGGM